MDMAMADVTDLPEVRTGDVAEVFGFHLPVEEQAAPVSYTHLDVYKRQAWTG